MDLEHIEADYTDVYRTDTILSSLTDHPAVRATRVSVNLVHVPDSRTTAGAQVRVNVRGEQIVQHDGRYVPGQEIQVYGLAQDQHRYELCRDAVLETMRRHDVAAEEIDGFAFLAPWEEWRQQKGSRAANLSGTASYYLHADDPEDDVEDDRF